MLSALHSMDSAYLGSEFSKGMIDTLKKSMTLEFANRSNGNGSNLLDSPDLKMVQWTTPDLENMIFQQNGLLNLQAPTPGLVRLVSLREDEKPDLRGFDEALAKLHAQRNADSLQQFAENEYSPAPPRNSEAQSMQQIELVYSRAPSKRPFNEAIIEESVIAKQSRLGSSEDDESFTSSQSSCSEEDDESSSYSQSQQRNVPRGALNGVAGARTATRPAHYTTPAGSHAKAGASGHYSAPKRGASGVHPVDYPSQDKMRVERKRERNRLAARKCRERKIKKIDELSGQVQKLEGDKKALATRISRMQNEIGRLQSIIQEHAHSGCKIPMGPR